MALFSGQRNLLSLALVFAAGLGGGAAAVWYLVPRPAQERRDDRGGAKPAGNRVAARGRLEPEGGVVNVAAPGPDVLQKLEVHEGNPVKKDQELAVLGSRKMRQIEQDVAKSQLDEAEDRRVKSVAHLRAQQKESDTRIEQLRKQAPLDLQIQMSKIKVLESQLATADGLMMRMRRAGSYTQQELDQQQLLRDQAEQELSGTRAALDKIREANESAIRAADAQRDVIIADLQRAQSELPVASLKKSLELSAERLAQTVVRSPLEGKVLKVLAREGELVGAGPVFQIADTRSMVAVAEVYETDVKAVRDWVRSGQRVEADVEIRFPGGPSTKFRGQVTHVADMVAKNTAMSLDPRQEVDRRVVEVRIKLDDKHQTEAAEYINMQVDVTIFDPQGPKPQ